MKVLHLTTHLNSGGITIYILRLANHLKQIGVELSVVSSGGACTSQFQEGGIETDELPIRTKSELDPKIYFALPSLIRLIREKGIDVLHAHTRVTQVMAFWAQKFTGIPVVTTCHGFYKRRLGRRLNPAWGDVAIAISQPVEDRLANVFKLPQDRIRMVLNGIDVERLDRTFSAYDPASVRKEYGFGMKDPVVGVVARLIRDKGHSYLIRAVEILRHEFPNLRLLIVGDGPERENLIRLVKELRLEDRTVFTGNLEEVCKPLAAMDIFAFPATWREGFGLSIAEAMTCKKPVIVTNIWALNALILDHATGILIEPRRSDLLAEAIRELLTNPEMAQRIASEGRKKAVQLFSIQRMANEIKQVYQEALSLRGQDVPEGASHLMQ